MEQFKTEKLNKFLQDDVLVDVVYDFVFNHFLKENKDFRDVNVLASERLAVDRFRSAWKDLKALKDRVEISNRPTKNIGL